MLVGDGAQLLNELMLSEHIFLTLISALDQRNTRHESMQRRISELGPHVALDGATIAILKDMTDSIYGLCDDAISNLNSSFEKLKVYIESEFPGAKALRAEWKY